MASWQSLVQQPLLLIAVGSAFVLVLSLWLMALASWSMRRSAHQQQIDRRLNLKATPPDQPAAQQLWLGDRMVQLTMPSKTPRPPLANYMQRLRRAGGWEAPASTLILNTLGLLTIGFLAGYLPTYDLLAGMAGMAAMGTGLTIYVNRRLTQRQALFDRQLVDALGLATRSLRAGHPLGGAFQLIATETEPPIGQIFADICQQQNLGVDLDKAIVHAAENVDSTDLKLFATSVVIQLRSGGNLADMMDRLSQVIRERLRLSRRIRILTAQTNLSKNVLIALPFIILVLIGLLNPHYASPLYETEHGRQLLTGAGVSVALGAWVMKKMTMLRY